jgi:ferric-dicitrate binding protein FerR (iron transport regulator)
MSVKGIFTIVLSLLLLLMPVSSATASSPAAKMITTGSAEINGVVAPAETSAFIGDRIATGKESTTSLSFSTGDSVVIPELTKAALGEHDGRVVLNLEDGTVSVVSKAKKPIVVMAHGARVEAAGNEPGEFSVTIHGNTLRVVPSSGAARVVTANRTGDIQPGTALDATLAPNPSPQGNNFVGSTLTWVIVGVAAAGTAVGVTAYELTKGSSSPAKLPPG